VNRRVTQQDIAKRLGLDKSTVSLALRNHPGIAPATREKVRAAAEKLGYRPDPALSTLARQRWAGHETGSGAALAYLVDSRMKHYSQHRRFLRAARARAEERGYLVRDFDLAEYDSVKSVARVLNHRGIRGLLVPQFEYTDGPGILEMPVENFTIVCLDLGWMKAPFHIVSIDRFEGARMVWNQTVERGYRRVGGAILSHTPHALDDASRYGASSAAQQELLRPRERIPLLSTDHTDRDGFLRWFERHEPEVVIGFLPRVCEWILATGRRVPEDVAFACLTVDPVEYPSISGVRREVDSVGSTGVDARIAAMHENEWGMPVLQRKLLLEPTWHEGLTLPPRAGSREAGAPSRPSPVS
jgi:LacI family transcriptional regulator